MLFVFIIVGIAIYIVYKYAKAYRLPENCILCFTGTLGAGKTYRAVDDALRLYKKQRFQHSLYKKFPFIVHWLPDSKYPASLYSTIPIQINLSKKHPEYCEVLKKEHLMLEELLPEKCVLVVDEFGSIASQWEFDNPFVMERLEKFVRFYRQWLNGRMFCMDQTSDSIVKPVRDRVGYIYCFNNFRRMWGFLPFYMLDVIPILMTDVGRTELQQEEPTQYYLIGFLPYKWMNIKHYESRCFKPLYRENAVRTLDKFDSLFTRYLIDISVSRKVKNEYKNDIEKFKDFMYSRFPINPLAENDEKKKPLLDIEV